MKQNPKTGTGIIITKLGEVGTLHGFGLELIEPGKEARKHYLLAVTPERALFESIPAFGIHAESLRWVAGNCITKRQARKMGLAYRVRAPGGGRKPGRKGLKQVTIWMTPAEKAEFAGLANLNGLSLGNTAVKLVRQETARILA